MNRSPANVAVVRGNHDLPSPPPRPVWTLRLADDASPLRRFLHGFLLHLIIAGSLLKDPAHRRRYLQVTVVQVIVTVVLALIFVPVQQYVREATREVEREAEAALQQTLGVVQSGLAAATDRRGEQVPVASANAPADGAPEDRLASSLDDRVREFRLEVEALRVAQTPPVPPVPSVSGLPPPPPPLPGVTPPEVDVPEIAAGAPDDERIQELIARARESAEEARELAREGEGTLAQVKQLHAAAAMHRREAAQVEQELERTLQAHEAELSQALLALEKSAAAEQARAPELAAELRAEARELEQEGAERRRELQQSARERRLDAQQVARELEQDAAELQREAAARRREAQQRERQAEQIARSAELVAREAALRATETLRERLEARPTARPEELENQLVTLEHRLEQAMEDESLSADARAQVAMGVAIEASFVAQRASDELRRQSRLLRRNATSLGEEQREEAEDAVATFSEVAEEARELAREARAEAKSALTMVAAAARELEPTQRRIVAAVDDLSPFAQLALFLAALYAGLYVVQSVVILFAREYHDAFSRDASLATGLAPEDPDRRPRVRLDWKWLRTRMWRRWRALKLFALGLPVVYLLTWWLPGGLRTFALSAWGAYWFIVFVAAKSARAWVDEGVAAEPWFLRGASRLARRFRLLGTAPFRLYGKLWRKHGTSVFAPAECVERQPWEFAGLTLFRFLASFPLVKLFFRPFTPVASAHLLESHRVHHPTRRRVDAAAFAGGGWD